MVMRLISILKGRKKQESDFTRSIEVISYPDRILITTSYRTKAGFEYVTDQISWLPLQATAEELGKAARKHLQMSKADVDTPTDFSPISQAYKKATGLKSIKARMKDARCVIVGEGNGQITIVPTRNGGAAGAWRGYHHLADKEIKIESTITDSQLGELIRNGWNRCE